MKLFELRRNDKVEAEGVVFDTGKAIIHDAWGTVFLDGVEELKVLCELGDTDFVELCDTQSPSYEYNKELHSETE